MNGNVILSIAVAAAVLVPLIWVLTTYNGLVQLRQYVRESWADVDTELKRRHDLIPNLVSTVKGYAAHERQVLEEVTRARQQAADATGSVASQADEENKLVGSLRQLVAVAEQYPNLKADKNFLALQQELANTEDRIQAARRFYNANVRDLNTRIESVPSNFIAQMGHFQRADFFEVADAGIRAVPKVDVADSIPKGNTGDR